MSIYHEWLIDCVENRKWSWARIASCLIHTELRRGLTRKQLLDGLKLDYELAKQK